MLQFIIFIPSVHLSFDFRSPSTPKPGQDPYLADPIFQFLGFRIASASFLYISWYQLFRSFGVTKAYFLTQSDAIQP